MAEQLAFDTDSPDPMELLAGLASPFFPDAHGALSFSKLLSQLYAGQQKKSKRRSAHFQSVPKVASPCASGIT